MGSTGNDPRPDQVDRPHQSPEAGKNKTYEAPGGLGTGRKDDPVKKSTDYKDKE